MLPEEFIVPNVATIDDEPEVNHGSKADEITIDENEDIIVKDATADASIIPPPPTAKIWPVKLSRNTDKKLIVNGKEYQGIFPNRDKTGKPRVAAHLILALIDESEEAAYNGFKVNAYVDSGVYGGRATSALHSLLNYLGNPVSNSEKPFALTQKATDVIDDNPLAYAKIDWKINYDSGEVDKLGNKIYITPEIDEHGNIYDTHQHNTKPLNRMENFPVDSEGNRIHFIESPKDGQVLYAQADFRGFVKNPNS
jgi:hypothetical protein